MAAITSFRTMTDYPGHGLLDVNGELSRVYLVGSGLEGMSIQVYRSDKTGSRWTGKLVTSNIFEHWYSDVECKSSIGLGLGAGVHVGDPPDVSVTVDAGTDLTVGVDATFTTLVAIRMNVPPPPPSPPTPTA